ncbi:pectate lyase superfamily protein-domain-containing protein [Paecilomyces variotii]|uniref:Pectate lyase superfamily protein-domain-containing protein n=1 Tax=Byssochlamys spectabilis TaxID=264951 RepID=A0A443HY68_BYSSP|nr:pectate lyase superfamily protein-domain-containing protein [Paecilomyces variotii]KAJ9354921.1 CAZyme family GH55 [Paecilomyces variotii]RWQ96694.1 pectate lyase superfamily protein-domain-containing protein [Paecilomyces variotii]
MCRSLFTSFLLLASASAAAIQSNWTAPADVSTKVAADASSFWLEDIKHQGLAAFNSDPSSYVVFRNVMDYGAKGDGSTDDTAAINAAISDGNRNGPDSRESSTTTPAIVYFPAGTYVVSTSIIDYYFTQLIGNPNDLPVIKATSGFTGLGVIDGDQYQSDGNQGWTSTNVFYRQIRNLIIDLTDIPGTTAATGIHWPTGQATSIQNVEIRQSADAGTQHQGIFIENGSGGWLSDVTITGGLYGANIGNQQYTMRNLTISNAVTGISQIWNWGWTYQGLSISNCTTAFSMNAGGTSDQAVGSVNIIDSTISDCSVFVTTAWTTSGSPASGGTLMLENINLSNTPVAVNSTSGTVLEGGTTTIASWGEGHKYTPSGPNTFQGTYSAPTRASALLASGSSAYYTKSKPQYEASPTSSFVSIRTAGAKGDGSTDDTSAINSALTSAASSGSIVFFDQGTYKVTNTIYIPPGSRIVGESYPVIMASGDTFSDKTSPVAVVQVGKSGDSGSVEWSDMIVSTEGSAAGAVLIEWNLNADSGSGMWDVHTRIGGFAGSNLQVAQCPTSAAESSTCEAAYMSMHITSAARNAYLENVWLWTADHDLDSSDNTQISVYTGRGLLIEGQNAWLYGTAVEHHSLYQYQFSGAKDIVAGFIQTETPYYQPNPDAKSSPYPTNSTINDPDYTTICATGSGNCDALGLRVLNSQDITIIGAGLYSFFDSYSTTCSDQDQTTKCQSLISSIEGDSTSNLYIYSLTTVGSTDMIVTDGTVVATYSDNVDTFGSTLAYFTYSTGS